MRLESEMKGETCSYYKDGDENIDPDIDLSYIDDRIQHVLGHFQKEFEGGVSAENLGAKFGGYGSFLPTYELSPSVWSHPETGQKNQNTSRSPNNLPMEVLIASSNAHPSLRLGKVSCGDHTSHNSKVPSGRLPSLQVADKCSSKDETSNRSSSQTDQRTLKFRIKMSSDNKAKKNALYTGLGLNVSPSSSSGNSHERNRQMPSVSRATVDESPTNIVKVMTSFPIPGDFIISPLHDNFLSLNRKEKITKASRVDHSLKGVQKHSFMLVDEPVSMVGDTKVFNEKKKKLAGQSKRQADTRHGNGIYFENEKQNSRGGFVEKSSEQRLASSFKDAPVDLRDDNKSKSSNISATLGAFSDVSKLEEDLDLQRQNVSHSEQDKKKVPRKKGKPSFEGKNRSKGILGNSKLAAVSIKKNLRVEMGAVPKDKKNTSQGIAPCSNKMLKLKSHDTRNVTDNNSDLLGGKALEPADNEVDQRDRHMADRPESATLCNVQVDRKTFLDNPREELSCKKVDEKLMSGLSAKYAPNACSPVMENRLTSQMAPAMVAPVVIEEDWVCCDSCQQWRLLPFDTKPEQLPEKWLCSMLNWLPGMNRCDIGEDETTRALRALYQLPVSESQNNQQNHTNLASFEHLDQNKSNFPSRAFSHRGKKRHGLKESPNVSSCDSPSRILNPTKSHLLEPVKSRSLNDINQSPLDTHQMKKSLSQHVSKPCNLEKNASKQTEKHFNGGSAKELRNKRKRDSNQYVCETSKRLKTESMYNTIKHQDSGIDSGKARLSLITKAKVKDLKNDEYSLDKDGNYGGPSDTKTCTGRDSSIKKRKMKHLPDNQKHLEEFDNSVHDGKLYKDQRSENGFRKEKSSRVSKNDGNEPSTNRGDDKLNSKDRVTQNILSGVKSHQVDEMDKGGVVKDQQPMKYGNKQEYQQASGGVFSFMKDLESGYVSATATSSSSKISSSHKIRGYFEEVKGSPVESVSSSPLRTFNSDKLMSAARDVFRKDDVVNGDLQSVRNSEGSLARKNGGTNKLGIFRQEKISSKAPSKSHKFSTLHYQSRDASHDYSAEHKPSSAVLKSHLLIGNGDVVDHHCGLPSDQCAVEHYSDEARVNKNHHEAASVRKKSCKVSSTSLFKDKEKMLTSDIGRGKLKVSDPASEHSQKNQKYDSNVDPNYLTHGAGTAIDVKDSLVKKLSIKSAKEDKNHISRKDHSTHGPKDSGMETNSKQRGHDGSDVKLGAKYSTYGNIGPQWNPDQDSEGCPVNIESKSRKSKLFPHFESDDISEAPILGCQPLAGSKGAGTLCAFPVDTSVNDDGPKIKQSGSDHSSMHLSLDQQGATDANVSSPVRNSSDLTATKILKEAKDLTDCADCLKICGFASESSEAYFQAALKFLHGAVLLESCSSESGRNGEMTHIEVYISTARLFELCAHDYERRHEMAAAALAYKCIEVAYMRVVYCNKSSTNIYWHELLATLQKVPQGESPSSSVSDVDNLNTQVTVDKATLSRGASHVAGNHIIGARTCSSLIQLFDFTQYVNSAMKASRKSLNAFMSANATLEEAQKKDCIASIRRVVHLSFHDIEELIHLVRLARESISCSGFGGA